MERRDLLLPEGEKVLRKHALAQGHKCAHTQGQVPIHVHIHIHTLMLTDTHAHSDTHVHTHLETHPDQT